MNDNTDDRLNDAARRALDRATAQLDDVTLKQLRAARERALEAARHGAGAPSRWLPRWFGLPGPALAAVGVAVAGAGLWLALPIASTPSPLAAIDDLELLAQQETPEFYADLEFYRWLASRGQTG